MEAMACDDIITSLVPCNFSCAQQRRHVGCKSPGINQAINFLQALNSSLHPVNS